MKITVICDVLGQKNNGTTIAATNLITYLQEKGHEVTVVSPDESTAGLENYYVMPHLNLGKFINGIFKNNGVQLAVPDEELLEKAITDADFVHILLPFSLGCKAVKIAQKLGVPTSASFHCQAENITSHAGLMKSHLVNKEIYKIFYKKLYRFVDAVHYPTQFIKEEFESNIKTTLPNSFVISNGVNDAFFAPNDEIPFEKFTIVCSGRYCAEKAQKDLLIALKKCKYKDRIKVIFAGTGPDGKRLKRRAKRYGIDAEFNFYTREDLVKVLHKAQLYVHTATIEIEAIACIEAIVCGLVPVICNSKKSATRFFALDKRCLFKPHDHKELREKIEYFFENPEEIAKLKKVYDSERSAFNQKDCMQKMEEMIIETKNKKAQK